jgi:hypothetical protein
MDQQRTETQVNRIGIVHVSLGQPIPLDKKIRDELRPDFSLTGDKALEVSMPTVAAALRYTLDSVIASLRIAGPSITDTMKEAVSSSEATTTEKKSTSETKEGATQTTGTDTSTSVEKSERKSESTKGRQVGEASKIDAPKPEDVKKAARSTTLPDISTIALGTDPILRYQNALSVLAAVKTLSAISDRLQPPVGWKAYIVPVRISLSPQGRNLPYELRSTLIFSGVRQTANGPKITAKEDEPSARVIPLGMDNHDAMSRASAEDIARSFGLGLGWIAGLTGIGADLGKINQATNTFRGTDIHSVMTAGQSGENTIDVRFGAMRTAENEFSAVERTHVLVLAIMVPEDAEQIVATSTNSFIHTLRGDVVSQVDTSGVVPEIYRTLRGSYGLDIGATVCKCGAILEESKQDQCKAEFAAMANMPISALTDEKFSTIQRSALRRLQQLAQFGRLTALGKCTGYLDSQDPTAGYSLVNLAASLARTMDQSRYGKAVAVLPREDKPEKPVSPPSQVVLLTDDSRAMKGYIGGGRNLRSAKEITAFVLVNNEEISATSISVEGDDGLALTFPSLRGFVKTTSDTRIRVKVGMKDHSTEVHRARYQLLSDKPQDKSDAKSKSTQRPKPDAKPQPDQSAQPSPDTKTEQTKSKPKPAT